MSQPQGFLVLDKSPGITSRDAVNVVQNAFPHGTKIGHAGTLDPLATGVLVLAVGKATRLIEYVQRMEKVYDALIELGGRSTTDDADGAVTPTANAALPSRAQLDDAVHAFVGRIAQVPPAFSAAKIEGRRAYALARRGADVALAARQVLVHEFRVERYEPPTVAASVRCGKGVYIRALARDLGERLGCGGLIRALRRQRIGPFRVADAVPLDAVNAATPLLPPNIGLPEQRLQLDDAQIAALRDGRPVSVPRETMPAEPIELALLDRSRRFHAIGRWDAVQGLVRPVKVFKDL
jgi:tRNA pseudouridine55 synthase